MADQHLSSSVDMRPGNWPRMSSSFILPLSKPPNRPGFAPSDDGPITLRSASAEGSLTLGMSAVAMTLYVPLGSVPVGTAKENANLLSDAGARSWLLTT